MQLRTLALAVFITSAAHANEISTLNSSVRALGMGDAFTALSADSSALFYNPAGLAKVRGINWKVLSVRAGASGIDAYKKIKDMNTDSQDDFAAKIDELYGEHVWTGVGAETAVTIPMFGFAIYDHADALVRVDNPINPEVYTNVVNDYGYVAGFGVPLSPILQYGMNFRYVKRTGARVPYGAAFLADLDSKKIYDNVNQWGKGYGLDLGVNAVIPAPFFSATVSAAWKNVGTMAFKSDNPGVSIPSEANDLTLGVALLFDTPLLSIGPAVDVRYLNDPTYQLPRKINFGVEVGLPVVDIRAGFREGYYTYGAGVNLGLFRVDAASYGVELGAYPGQIEDRRYVLEFSMELGVGAFGAAGSSSGGGASGSSSGTRSVFGGRLKQRR